jgi:pimeloyl-ACP methyl ester carboxylesterase
MNLVLVHGAWHDGSCWDGVRAALEGAGHRVHTPTLAGHGPGADPAATHADCVRVVVECIAGQSLQDVVLVGHSFGGTVIQKAAEAVAERLARLVFLNAFVLRDGEGLLDALPADYARVFEVGARASGEGTMLLPFAVFRDGFIGDADLATARRVYAGLRPTPFGLMAERLDLKRFWALRTPRSYLNCTEDVAFPAQAGGWHPAMSTRLGLFRLVQMPGSHESMYTRPAELAAKLVEAGRD